MGAKLEALIVRLLANVTVYGINEYAVRFVVRSVTETDANAAPVGTVTVSAEAEAVTTFARTPPKRTKLFVVTVLNLYPLIVRRVS